MPFDKVLNSLNNPYIKKNLAELKEKALLSRDYGFEDLQYLEKFEYRDYTHYSLYMSNYTPQRPYYLYYILEVDKVTLEEKSGFLKYIPDERMEVFDIRKFTGTMELYNNEMQLFGGAVFSEGEITSNSIGTTTCYTEIVMIGHPCTYGGEHMPGEACNGENGNGISDAYYSFSSFTWCETEYDYSSPPGGFTGGAGGGPTLSRLQIFYLRLDQNQINYLNQNPDIKAIIEDYVVRANAVSTGEKMVDLGLSNSNHLQMVLDYIANNPDYTLEDKNFIYFMVNFLTDNPTITPPQYDISFIKNIIQQTYDTDLTFDTQRSYHSPFYIDMTEVSGNSPEEVKFREVYDKLLQSPLFKELFINMFNSTDILNTKFVINDIPVNNALGKCKPFFNSSGAYTNLITIDKPFLLEASDDLIALTIIHECIHAFLNVKLLSPSIGMSISDLTDMNLQDCINEFYDGFTGMQSQHNFFVDYMYPVIANILLEIKPILYTQEQIQKAEYPSNFGGISINSPSGEFIQWNWEDYFRHFAFYGLQDCDAYDEVYPQGSLNLHYYIQYISAGLIMFTP